MGQQLKEQEQIAIGKFPNVLVSNLLIHCLITECLNYLKQQFAHGEPPTNSFVPRCDRDQGDFERLQCTGEHCFCVEPRSGKEIPGTTKKREGNFILRCDDKGLFK